MSYDIERVIDILGGPRVIGARIRSVRDLDRAVGSGLPKASLDAVTRAIHDDPKRRRSLRYTVVPEATYKRRRDRLSVAESEKTERLARIAAFAERVWRDQADARAFLTTPHAMLGDRSPVEAAATDLGARQVEDILGAIEHGLPV